MRDVLSASASAMSGEFAKSTVVYPCRVSLVSIPEKIQANPTLWVSCPMMRVICRRPLVQSLVRVIFLCLNQMRDFCSRRWEGYDLAIRARRSMGAPCIQYQRDGNRPSSKIRAWSFQNLHSSLQLCELTEISECSATLRKQNNMIDQRKTFIFLVKMSLTRRLFSSWKCPPRWMGSSLVIPLKQRSNLIW